MKTIHLLLLAFLATALGCQPSFESKVTEMHDASRQIEKAVAPKLEQLVQQKNGISIQGRALTPEEMAFTAKVSDLEATYANWKNGMAEAEKMPADEKRLSLEQQLKDGIMGFQKMVEGLVPKPGL